MNEELYDILESCLQELQHGAELESLLARYPKFAAELRPALKASMQAQNMSAPMPSREAVMRGRARLMQKVAETREGKIAPRKRVIPFFHRIAISLSITAGLLVGGTGLVGASSSALPGQNLYPVKRNWESVRLFFTFDQNARLKLEDEFKHEREHEANELLFEKEEYEVEFYGVLNTVNGVTYVSSLPVVFPAGAQIPADGTPLEVKGRTTDQGYVEVIQFEMELPDGDQNGDENESGSSGETIPAAETAGKKEEEKISAPAATQGSNEYEAGSLITPTPTWSPGEQGSSSESTEQGDDSSDGEDESSSD